MWCRGARHSSSRTAAGGLHAIAAAVNRGRRYRRADSRPFDTGGVASCARRGRRWCRRRGHPVPLHLLPQLLVRLAGRAQPLIATHAHVLEADGTGACTPAWRVDSRSAHTATILRDQLQIQSEAAARRHPGALRYRAGGLRRRRAAERWTAYRLLRKPSLDRYHRRTRRGAEISCNAAAEETRQDGGRLTR